MTNPSITLHGVSCTLPDGRVLFSDLNDTFDLRPTGLVGRNGAGKTVLARILAGELSPSTGLCSRSGPVHYLPQRTAPLAHETVATLSGMHETLAALARIEAGSTHAQDFDAVGTRWDARQRLQRVLHDEGLSHVGADTPARHLSGGEALRVALMGAWLSEADFLILDEPTNHLDRDGRRALIERLRAWPRGLVIISHDRGLLDTMARIIELTPEGLDSYGGNYTQYAQARDAAQAHARQALSHVQAQRRRELAQMREAEARQRRHQARDARAAKDANQARILLDRQKARSESTAGRVRIQQAARREALLTSVRDAAARVQADTEIAVHGPAAIVPSTSRRVLTLSDVVLPFVDGAAREVSLTLQARQRVGVIGPNGAGKSTLLRVIAGQLTPLAGTIEQTGPAVYLDQALGGLDTARSVLAQVREVNASGSDGDLRTRLAHLGLGADKLFGPSGQLSGGERVKAALACVLYADTPPALLLLDEPSNHLDLASTHALEAMLRDYTGAMMVVSHEDAFLVALGLTDLFAAQPTGWQWLAPDALLA